MPSIEGRFNTPHVLRNGNSPEIGDAQPSTVITGQDQNTPTDQKIDLQVLANKVYELLKQELRLEQERLGRSKPG